jgi:hypothetical protein
MFSTALRYLVVFAACACSGAERNSEPVTANPTQVWAIKCPDQLSAELRPDGRYDDGGGGHGRWWMEGKSLRLQVVKPHTIEFMSLYPELLSMDEDGHLPFVAQGIVEAELDGFKHRFRRCS